MRTNNDMWELFLAKSWGWHVEVVVMGWW
jgi:hypothetical protein